MNWDFSEVAERKAIYFLSDMHLGASYFADPIAKERHVVAFLESIRHDAAAIYLVGDVLDYWYEYRQVVPRGFVRFFGKLAELADQGVKITWMIGNHDIWIFDYLPRELGIEVADGVLVREMEGKKFLITHGDGVGKMSRTFRLLRGLFRNKLCQKMYASVHPRWTIPFAKGWSSQNRGTHPVASPYQGPEAETLMLFAREYALEHPDIDYFIFGHRHILVDEEIAAGKHAVILGEWIDLCSYARFADGRLTLHKYITT